MDLLMTAIIQFYVYDIREVVAEILLTKKFVSNCKISQKSRSRDISFEIVCP